MKQLTQMVLERKALEQAIQQFSKGVVSSKTTAIEQTTPPAQQPESLQKPAKILRLQTAAALAQAAVPIQEISTNVLSK